MNTVLVASFENKQDAAAAARLIKKFHSTVKVMRGELWEDLYLAKMIDEGMKEECEVPLEKIRKKLRK